MEKHDHVEKEIMSGKVKNEEQWFPFSRKYYIVVAMYLLFNIIFLIVR